VDDHGTPGDLEEERYRDAAHDELREETGLSASSLTLLGEGRKELACRRGGTWHYWRVYVAEASGEVVLNPDEAVRHIWCDKAQLEALLRGGAIETEHGSVTLEPVWIDWLGELDIVSQF
jgi:8-oxo-dGTP pyrophosphatase MutT (NUDIX family)